MIARERHEPSRIASDAPTPALRVGFLLAHNFTLSALSLFVDALRLAADEGDRSRPIRCGWSIMAPTPEPIRASCGLLVTRTAPLTDPSAFDYIVVVGGILHSGRQMDEAALAYLRQAAAAGVTLVGVCIGSFILSRAGLMKGRRCCVSWYHVQDYESEFPDHYPIADRLFVVDGDRITCSGGSGVADLAASLIETHLGRAVAQKSLHVLLLQHARSGSNAQPHPTVDSRVGDDRIQRALLLMEQHIGEPLAVEAIAARLGLSIRHLERLFRAEIGLRPAVVYRRLRLRHARWLIDNTQKSITEIAVEAGFCDGAHFSRQFKELFGLPPRQARAKSARRGTGRPAEDGAAGLRHHAETSRLLFRTAE